MFSSLNLKMDSTFKHMTTILSGYDYELALKSNTAFQVICVGSETRSATIFGHVWINGNVDYWVDKPSSSQIEISSNTNKLIIGNPSGAGGITVVLSYC